MERGNQRGESGIDKWMDEGLTQYIWIWDLKKAQPSTFTDLSPLYFPSICPPSNPWALRLSRGVNLSRRKWERSLLQNKQGERIVGSMRMGKMCQRGWAIPAPSFKLISNTGKRDTGISELISIHKPAPLQCVSFHPTQGIQILQSLGSSTHQPRPGPPAVARYMPGLWKHYHPFADKT